MHYTRKSKFYLTISVFILMIFSCQKDNLPDYRLFLIEVESIAMLEEVTTNTPFNIQFFGLIGNNGCYQFSHLNIDKQTNTIVIEVWGKLNTSSQICSDEMVGLRGKQLNYTINKPGKYTFKIKQSQDHFITKKIVVI